MELSAQERPAKRLRMTRKTNAQTATLSVLLEGEDTDAVRAVYLVTLPHPSSEGGAAGGNLVAPGTMSREAVRDAVIACCRAPEHDPVWLRRHPFFLRSRSSSSNWSCSGNITPRTTLASATFTITSPSCLAGLRVSCR